MTTDNIARISKGYDGIEMHMTTDNKRWRIPNILEVPFTHAEDTVYWFYHGKKYDAYDSGWLRLAK